MTDSSDPDALSTYMSAVRRLTSENRQLKEELRVSRTEYRTELGLLRAQLNEGLTPELLVLRGELSRWRTRAQAAEARLRHRGGVHGQR